jgi:sec-independent protein translocase protein TatC
MIIFYFAEIYEKIKYLLLSFLINVLFSFYFFNEISFLLLNEISLKNTTAFIYTAPSELLIFQLLIIFGVSFFLTFPLFLYNLFIFLVNSLYKSEYIQLILNMILFLFYYILTVKIFFSSVEIIYLFLIKFDALIKYYNFISINSNIKITDYFQFLKILFFGFLLNLFFLIAILINIFNEKSMLNYKLLIYFLFINIVILIMPPDINLHFIIFIYIFIVNEIIYYTHSYLKWYIKALETPSEFGGGFQGFYIPF